jgi:leucyl-tRNA synthetase
LKEDTLTIVVQVNGKLRDRLDVPASIANEELEKRALANDRVKESIAGTSIKKIIIVPGKLVNIVAA